MIPLEIIKFLKKLCEYNTIYMHKKITDCLRCCSHLPLPKWKEIKPLWCLLSPKRRTYVDAWKLKTNTRKYLISWNYHTQHWTRYKAKKIDLMDSVRWRKVECDMRFYMLFLFFTEKLKENADFLQRILISNFAYFCVCACSC